MPRKSAAHPFEGGRVAIYQLVDPRTDEVRYIGQTIDISARMYQHIATARTQVAQQKADGKELWLYELDQAGHSPVCRVIEMVDQDQAPDAERRAIRDHAINGARLFNILHNPPILPPVAMPQSDLITLVDAAERVGISARRLRQYATEDPPRLRTIRVGGGEHRASALLTRWEWVEECMASRQRAAPPPPADPEAAAANMRKAWKERHP